MNVARKLSIESSINECPKILSRQTSRLHSQVRRRTRKYCAPVDQQFRFAVVDPDVSEGGGFRSGVEAHTPGRLLDFPLAKYMVREPEFAIEEGFRNSARQLPAKSSFPVGICVNKSDVLQVG